MSTTGQRVSASDRLYLAGEIPVLIVWGEHDPIIPASHGEEAHRAIPGSRLELFAGVGHLPQVEQPARFVAALEAFVRDTEPARWSTEEWRARLQGAAVAAQAA